MLINFDEIPIPSDKLDNIVSENLDAIKKQTRKRSNTGFLQAAPRQLYLSPRFPHSAFPTLCSLPKSR